MSLFYCTVSVMRLRKRELKTEQHITMKQVTKQLTTTEVKAVEHGNPEWVDFKGLFVLFGIRRSLGYALAAEGKIHSVSLRNRGRTRGKRLFSCDSIRSYLDECSNGNGNT